MRKTQFAPVAALILAAGLALSGCGTSDTGSDAEMDSDGAVTLESLAGSWNLTGALGPNGAIEELPEGALTIEPDGAFGFEAQCNQFSGTMTVVDGVVLTGDGGVQTLMLCDGVVGEVDAIASSVFAHVQSASLTVAEDGPETLSLVDDNGDALEFERR